MSRGALQTGAVGGIIGALTSFVGILWSIIYFVFASELVNYISNMIFSILIGPLILLANPYPASGSLFSILSFILAILILLTGILIGIGFYGTYKIGGGAMGVVGLIFGIIGGALGDLFIMLGNLLPIKDYFPILTSITPPLGIFVIPITYPHFLIIWIGFMILGVAFILLGSASITVREMTMHPSASSAAGILSIIGGAVFLAGVFFFIFLIIIGFILIFAASIIWTVVFYSSREM